MPRKIWSDLSSMQLGEYGEYYAKMEFTSYGFDVYTSEVDDHGVDFIAKSKIVLQSNRLICFIRFNDNELPDCYVFPATVFEKPDGSLFTSKDYEGLKSQPEYGISVKKKENLEKMQKYQSEKILMELR